MRKQVFIAALLALATTGCLDLFGVPGIALSPDGMTIYYLTGETGMEEEFAPSLVAASPGGQTRTVVEGTSDVLVTAFAVNPVNGDLAYVASTDTATSLMVVSSDGSTRELAGADAFGGVGVGTMMQYAPNGRHIAVTMVMFPPGVKASDIQAEEEDTSLTSDQLAQIRFVAFVVDAESAAVTTVSDPETERANTVAWNPGGTRVAYNAWIDGDGDGTIMTVPGEGSGDLSQIRVYDVVTGERRAIASQNIDYAPAFADDDTLLFVSINPVSPPLTIQRYDLNSNTGAAAYESFRLIVGLSPSHDGSQIAWIEVEDSEDEEEDSPSYLFVADMDFAAPRQVAEIPPDMGLPDVPTWTPDGALLVTATGFVSALMNELSVSFSFSTDGEATAEATPPPLQRVLRVDTASGETTVIHEGRMMNSSFFSSLIGLVASGALEEMFGGLE